MIAKLTKGRGFRGALNYDLNQEKGRLIDKNMAGETPEALSAEFGQIRKLRPKLGRAVLHVALSAPVGEHLTDAQWSAIGRQYLKGMGFTDNQYIMTRHTDTEHEHIHILANRITHQGEVVSESQDYSRQEALMRQIERDHGLQVVAPSQDAQRKAPTKGEIEKAVRTGEASTRQKLQHLVDAAVSGSADFGAFHALLDSSGVEVVPVVQLGGAKLAGLSYRLDGVLMKGSDLGRGYTPSGLAKKGIPYEQDRDFAAVGRDLEREAGRSTAAAVAAPANGPTGERGADRGDRGAAGAGDGRADGRDAQNTGGGAGEHPGAGKELSGSSGGAGENIPAEAGAPRKPTGHGQHDHAQIIEQPGRVGEGADVAALRPVRGNGDDFSDPRARIVALAGTAPDPDLRAGRANAGAADPARDRSLEALQKQIEVLGVDQFEIDLVDIRGQASPTGNAGAVSPAIHRKWRRGDLEKSVSWLKRMNARGHDIHIRPVGEHALVMLDGLAPAAVERLRRDGLAPAAEIDTGTGTRQVWLKLSDQPVPEPVRLAAAAVLVEQYGGDREAAERQQSGRLAGFTNQDPAQARGKLQPYVQVRDSAGQVAAAAPALLVQAAHRVDQAQAREERRRRRQAISHAPSDGLQRVDPVAEYQRQARVLLQRYGEKADLVRMDWMIATDMAKRGVSEDAIARGIQEGSPSLQSCRPGVHEAYARQTAQRAGADEGVVKSLQEQRVQADKARAAAERAEAERAAQQAPKPKPKSRGMDLG